MARAFAAFAFFGAGVTHVNGGGTITYIGGSYASFLVASIYAGIGGWVFQGSGSSTFLAVPQSRYAVVHNLVRTRRGRQEGRTALACGTA